MHLTPPQNWGKKVSQYFLVFLAVEERERGREGEKEGGGLGAARFVTCDADIACVGARAARCRR
eukprot:3358469-Rhodomonas_salina.2